MAFCRMLRPVPEFIAAVIPTTRSSRSHSRRSASPNTCVYCGGGGAGLAEDALAAGGRVGDPLRIDFGLAACHFSLPSRPPSSAGREPLPLARAVCPPTGTPAAHAWARAAKGAAPDRGAAAEAAPPFPAAAAPAVAHPLLDPHRIADRGRGMARANDVGGRLGDREKRRQPAVLADRAELLAPA